MEVVLVEVHLEVARVDIEHHTDFVNYIRQLLRGGRPIALEAVIHQGVLHRSRPILLGVKLEKAIETKVP